MKCHRCKEQWQESDRSQRWRDLVELGVEHTSSDDQQRERKRSVEVRLQNVVKEEHKVQLRIRLEIVLMTTNSAQKRQSISVLQLMNFIYYFVFVSFKSF